MNRIDRISAILIHLQSRKIVKAQDIADRFAISLRTVYRDIRTLEEAGIPLVGEAGLGYSIMDGYRLPPVMFTTEEATAFLTAEKLVEKLTDAATRDSYKSAMYKIKSVLRSTEKDYLETMEAHIEVLPDRYLPADKNESSHLQAILKSISGKQVLGMKYFSNHTQENTERHVEPVGIFYSGNNWYMIAYCRLRKDYRHFRADRISSIQHTGLHYEQQHPSLKTFLKQVTAEKELQTVVMHVNKNIIKHFGDQKYYNGFVSQKELKDVIEMTFLTSSLEGFARWYLTFGDMAEIRSPENLRTRIREIAGNIAKKQ
jgi:predicted DNA-binding transcriptional regulator YafY